MNTILKKSNTYIIGGCIILIFISIGILIYILNRKKNGGGGGGGGGGGDYKYTQENVSKNAVCAAPYSSSMNVDKYVKNLCELDKDCTGYYGSDNDGWFIATDKDPDECSVKDQTSAGYTNYFKKPSYTKTTNTTGKYGCQLKMSNICENCLNGNYVENLCNLDPDCTGYYTNADKTKIVATNDDPVSDIFCDILYTTDLNLFNRRSPPPPPPPPLPQPTLYYPFNNDIKNYASGTGVNDAVMGVGGNDYGGTASFSDGGLVLTGSPTHNASGASYVVLPSNYSGKTASFCCWFKSNNNSEYTRIIDMNKHLDETFRLYIVDQKSLKFNEVFIINTKNIVINNNTWNFIAINANENNLSWWIQAFDAKGNGESGFGYLSNPVTLLKSSPGYLGHSFGQDPEFAGSLKEVRFFADKNLTLQEINRFYEESK